MFLRTVAVAFVLSCAASAHADSFRCPNGSLVSTGDSISEVSLKCDPPTSVVRRDEPIETTRGKQPTLKSRNGPTTRVLTVSSIFWSFAEDGFLR